MRTTSFTRRVFVAFVAVLPMLAQATNSPQVETLKELADILVPAKTVEGFLTAIKPVLGTESYGFLAGRSLHLSDHALHVTRVSEYEFLIDSGSAPVHLKIGAPYGTSFSIDNKEFKFDPTQPIDETWAAISSLVAPTHALNFYDWIFPSAHASLAVVGVAVVVIGIVYFTAKEVSCGKYSMYLGMCPNYPTATMVDAFNFDQGKFGSFGAKSCPLKRNDLRKCLNGYFTNLTETDQLSVPQNVRTYYFGTRAASQGNAQGSNQDKGPSDTDATPQNQTKESAPAQPAE